MTDLRDQVDTLTRRLESLEQQNAELRAELDNDESARKRFDRRGLLRLGGVAAAVGAGSVLLRPGVAGATTGNLQFGSDNDAGAASTGLASSITDPTNPVDTLHVTNSGTGANSANASAITGHMTDLSNQGTAILGLNDGFSDAIVGEVTSNDVSANGSGVVGIGIDFGGVIGVSSGSGPGVGGLPFGTGPGVSGWSSSGADGMEAINDDVGVALRAHTMDSGTGTAIVAQIENADSKASVLKAIHAGNGVALDASSHGSYGARIASGNVQLRLVPHATRTTHPPTGSAGTLFVDHKGHLWYCYATNHWKELA